MAMLRNSGQDATDKEAALYLKHCFRLKVGPPTTTPSGTVKVRQNNHQQWTLCLDMAVLVCDPHMN